MKINLLTETEAIMQKHHYTWRAVKFIANAEGVVEIAQFVATAKAYEYENNDSEVLGVDPTLVIVGGTWWLSRVVGSNGERWLFHKKPQKPTLPSVDFDIATQRSENKKTII